MNNRELLIALEEHLNLYVPGRPQPSAFSMTQGELMDLIREQLPNGLPSAPSLNSPIYDKTIQYIRRLGNEKFLRKNNGIKEAAFYTYAWIDKSTWSEMKNNRIKPSKKTLLKLVLALELKTAEAEAFLQLCNERFQPDTDLQDRVILIILGMRESRADLAGEMTLDRIRDLLFECEECYSDETHTFVSIYTTPDMIAGRKKA
jgi:hypothetical protein